jgi:hypothetical protein
VKDCFRFALSWAVSTQSLLDGAQTITLIGWPSNRKSDEGDGIMRSWAFTVDRNVADASKTFESAMAMLGGTQISRLSNGFSIQHVGTGPFQVSGTAILAPLDATRTCVDVVVPMPPSAKIALTASWVVMAILVLIIATNFNTAWRWWWLGPTFGICGFVGVFSISLGQLASNELYWRIVAGFMPSNVRPINVMPTPGTPQATSGVDIPDQLKALGQLRRDGVLSDAEFEAKKAELLKRM